MPGGRAGTTIKSDCTGVMVGSGVIDQGMVDSGTINSDLEG
jgi:hypothetical protein